ncbi:hypothetical protein [Vulcaniibacterium tengchongense]|uniref:Secreted protein n=1 Tax=Vulcaniibacterium tengchongense TaxID=1273429 RepID=A0A3N4VHV6_9GAMM|nr:hypothetical protein [Vulcaniibacterium tengchongense]RPE81075.1 hypothetical protein EDC50_0243 [Vulcaniibacterium tengchongense]
MRPFAFALAAAALSLAAAVPAAAAPARVAQAGPYVDMSAYVSGDAQIDAWYGGRVRLQRDFDAICGDTFCEGDYSNIQPLRFVCSVHQASGRLGGCVWTFAASDEAVDPRTGAIAVRPQVWRCPVPLAPRTTAEALLAVLAAESPLYAPLPGTDRSIYDGLIDCL